MGGRKGAQGVNSKKEAGQARKAAAKQAQQDKLDAQAAAREDASWQQGANHKQAARKEQEALKADDAARRRREKADLLAAEEEALGTGGKVKKTPAKKKKGKGNDLDLLEEALQSAADKKVKKQRASQLKQQQQQSKKTEASPAMSPSDPLMDNTEQMLGDLQVRDDVGRRANVAAMQEGVTSGIDAALDSLTGASASGEKTAMKYSEFEVVMLPQVKEDHPGLRLTQYKEKVWQLWKKSPDNPANQIPTST